MSLKSAECPNVQEFEGRFEWPRPGLRSLEPSPDALENTQPQGELRETNRQMRQYLAEVGHDLRTPLAAICDALHVLSLEGNDGATREFVGDLMERQTQRIGRLVDDLFEASRTGHGKIRFRKERSAEAGDVIGPTARGNPAHDERGKERVSLGSHL